MSTAIVENSTNERRMIQGQFPYKRLAASSKGVIRENGSNHSDGSEIAGLCKAKSGLKFTLEIEAEDSAIQPAEIRIRQWLKIGLRSFGLRARWASKDCLTTGDGRGAYPRPAHRSMKTACEHDSSIDAQPSTRPIAAAETGIGGVDRPYPLPGGLFTNVTVPGAIACVSSHEMTVAP